jgi:TetR/AcrR family transcriptional repressor of nem operon
MARPRKFDRDTLLEKALEVFWEKGYEATTVQDLGARMGVHPGSLFGTFGDKRTLFYEALNRFEARVRGILFAVLEEPVPRRAALERLFAVTIELMLDARAAGRRGCFMVNSLMERCPLDPDMDKRAQINLARLEGRLRTTLQEAMAGGEIAERPEEELRALARSLMANLLAIRLLARVGAEADILHDVARVALRSLDLPLSGRSALDDLPVLIEQVIDAS